MAVGEMVMFVSEEVKNKCLGRDKSIVKRFHRKKDSGYNLLNALIKPCVLLICMQIPSVI